MDEYEAVGSTIMAGEGFCRRWGGSKQGPYRGFVMPTHHQLLPGPRRGSTAQGTRPAAADCAPSKAMSLRRHAGRVP